MEKGQSERGGGRGRRYEDRRSSGEGYHIAAKDVTGADKGVGQLNLT